MSAERKKEINPNLVATSAHGVKKLINIIYLKANEISEGSQCIRVKLCFEMLST